MLEKNILHYIFMFQNTFWQDSALNTYLHENLIVVSRVSRIHTDFIWTIFSMMTKPVFIWLNSARCTGSTAGLITREVCFMRLKCGHLSMQWFSSRNQSLSAPHIVFSPACRYRLNVVYNVLSLRLFWYIFMFWTQIIF